MRQSVLIYACLAAGFLSLSAGYLITGLPWAAAVVLLVGILWISAEIRSWRWIGSIALFLLIIGAGIGIIVGVNTIWAILTTVFVLDAWEFSYFQKFIKSASWVRNADQLTRRHHRRVIIVSIIGATASWLTTQIEVNLGFGIALLLAIISLIGLSQAVAFLRKTA